MAAPTATVEVKPSAELTEALEEIKGTIENRLPFDYDTIEELSLQAAKLVGGYYYALVEVKVAPTLIDNLVYDFHRILWGQSLDS